MEFVDTSIQSSGASFRVLTAELEHETNTFCVIPTTIENFKNYQYIDTAKDIEAQRRGTKSSLGASFEAADSFGWSLVPSMCAVANPTGKVTNEAFETICDIMLAPLRAAPGSFHGILLHLHGAMVTETFEDAEGELLRRIRELAGPSLPIFVTLDLHGNITKQMVDNCTCLIAVRTYPHVDYYDRAWQASKLLQATMLGEIRPVTAIAKRALLKGLDGGKTFPGSPMQQLIDRGTILEQDTTQKSVLVVSICAGFTGADIYEIGPSVTVTVDTLHPSYTTATTTTTIDATTSALAHATAIAEDFMDYVWETREYVSEINKTIPEAIDCILTHQTERVASSGPLVIADVSDNPGSGHYGDATDMLHAMIKADVRDALLYAIFDPTAVRQGVAIGVGNRGVITIGGKTDPQCGGGPVVVEGTVVTLSNGHFPAYGPMGGGVWQNIGLSMIFRVTTNQTSSNTTTTTANTSNFIDIAIISNNAQLLDISQIISLGIQPQYKQTIVVKSKHHFRASLASMASKIICVDGNGLGSVILKGGNYVNVRRPIWPLDSIL